MDRVVEYLFFAADSQKDDNLEFVRRSLETSPERRPLLRLYQQVYQGENVREDERSLLQNRLRLIGLVWTGGGVLHVRNRIYERVFHLDWVKKHTPINWLHLQQVASDCRCPDHPGRKP